MATPESQSTPPDNDNPEEHPEPRIALWLFLAAVVLIGLILLTLSLFPSVVADPLHTTKFVYLVFWVAVLSGSLIVYWRAHPGRKIKNVALWIAIAAFLTLGYNIFAGRFTGG